MVNLGTQYLGFKLKNPLIISSSGLTNTIDKIKALEEHGAGAVVLKSLFEEQIKMDVTQIIKNRTSNIIEDAEYINSFVRKDSVSEYLELIEKAKKTISIPVFASINCYSAEDWTDFVRKIEDAGADAIELNIYYGPTDKDFTSSDYEKIYFNLASRVTCLIRIPVSVKLSPYFTNLSYVVDQLHYRNVSGVVLFNRFYEPDIDLKNLRLKAADLFSKPGDVRQTLRSVAIVSSQVENIDIAASTGIHSGDAAIKLILAGARAIEICSVIYRKSYKYINVILKDMEDWMVANNYNNINDFCGKMNYSHIAYPANWERAQFMRYFSDFQ